MKCRNRWTVSADGASLAFWDEGQGPAVVMTNGFANSTLYWEPLRRRLRENYRVIRWDLRGHGCSGAVRDPQTLTIDGCADDLRRVLDAAGVEKAVLAGFSLGCQIVLESWRHFPERISGIIPVFGPYESPFNTLIHPRVGPLFYEIYRRAGPAFWGRFLKMGSLSTPNPAFHSLGKLMGFVGANVSAEEMAPFYDHLAKIDMHSFYVMGKQAQRHSARDLLPTIEVPTLVVAGGADRFSPGELGRQMSELIPRAELVWIDEATHTGLFDARDVVGDAVERFLPITISH